MYDLSNNINIKDSDSVYIQVNYDDTPCEEKTSSGTSSNFLDDALDDEEDMNEENENEAKLNELKRYIDYKKFGGSPRRYSILVESPSNSNSDEEQEGLSNLLEKNLKDYNTKIPLKGTGSDDETVFENKMLKLKNDITRVELIGILSVLEWEKYDLYSIKEEVEKHFKTDMVTLTSNHLDIIASYLNSQKIIYLESSHITSKWLNALMIPTIVISCSASVISGAGDKLENSNLIISCITAFGAFLLAIINYLKLDAASEAHKMTSHQYDKLQNNTMFLSGKTLLFSEASFSFHTFHDKLRRKTTESNAIILKRRADCHKKSKAKYQENKKFLNQEMKKKLISEDTYRTQMYELKEEYQKRKEKCNDDADDLKQNMINESIVELETSDNNMQQNLIDEIREEISILQEKIKEIKESNHFEIPQSIRYRFPFSYGINVFSIIKSLEDYKTNLIYKLWVVKNNIKCSKVYIQTCNKLLNSYPNSEAILNELERLFEFKRFNHIKRKKIYEQIISLKTAYMEIDKLFQTEIQNDKTKNQFCGGIGWKMLPYNCCGGECKPSLEKIKSNLLYRILNNNIEMYNPDEIEVCDSNYSNKNIQVVDY
jgi:hypothetical protein